MELHPLPSATDLREADARFRQARWLIVIAASISLVLSISLWFTGSHDQGIFVGIWVPSVLSAGILLLIGGRHD